MSPSRPPTVIRSVLVANRGEIAVRLVRTLKALGIRSVALYSEADDGSLPVELADEASCIGPPPPSESYLRIDRILAAARHHAVDAVHPGYGFLSEREDFARAVEAAGLVFLGPQPRQIAELGDKLRARELMRGLGVPPVPGSSKPLAKVEEARRVAESVGYPLMLKAAAGGGGKGIRVVSRSSELEPSFQLASSEAENSFGSPLLFAERYLAGARHVEVQVLGDGDGGVRLFPERDCSIQRRLQKIVEESPSPAVSPGIRERLLRAALAMVEATKYRGPGTLEFLLAPDEALYFLEVNTRIQVEHPVTELLCATDLVAEQLRVAEGARYTARGLEESFVEGKGSAVELRINAEDPLSDFRPSVGTIESLRLPRGPDVRVDTALVEGIEITPYYDPLVAKVIARGDDRQRALARLDAALDELIIAGVATTQAVGRALLADPDFLAGRYHCQFLGEKLRDPHFLLARPREEELSAIAGALALFHHGRRLRRGSPTTTTTGAAFSAWKSDVATGCWELEGS
ncbi:MAG: ATP-grasp domain-containing protein [Planctomycetota bacterium]|nr:ATP-grasp domain-containing protein [Planctomycetota bacterium]